MTNTFSNNQVEGRYELEVDGHIAYASYHHDADVLVIDFVFAPEELRGTGAAGRLMIHIMDELKEKDVHVRPFCSYARSWLQRHTAYHAMVDF